MKLVFQVFNNLYRFYYNGFRNMSLWGRKVWLIVIIKLFIIFVILKLLFFPDFLRKKYDNDDQRGNYVRDQILNIR